MPGPPAAPPFGNGGHTPREACLFPQHLRAGQVRCPGRPAAQPAGLQKLRGLAASFLSLGLPRSPPHPEVLSQTLLLCNEND